MAANNTVEAVLRSKYEDGIEAGVENTRKLMQNAFASMKDGGAAAAAGIEAAFESTVGALESWRTKLSKAADDSDSSFKKMGLGAVAFGIAAAEVFVRAAKAAGDFVAETVKEASEYFQVKQSFDAVTAAAGAQAITLASLRKATEGQVSATTLMSSASRVVSAQLPGMTEMYPKLVENVARLAKAFGKDAVEAQDALTTAIIRGNSRGLGPALGIHLAVRDAVSEMAAAMDVNASKMTDSSKLTVFYNELLEQTESHIKSLPPNYLTLEEVMKSAKETQKLVSNEFGAAILHSGVLQSLLEKLQSKFLGVAVSSATTNTVALKTNEIIISLLRTFAAFVDVLNVVYIAVKVLVDMIAFDANVVFAALAFAITGIIQLLRPLFILLANVPVIGKYFRGVADDLEYAVNYSSKAAEEFGRGALHSFDGVGSGFGKLADNARGLANEMEKLKGAVTSSSGALDKHRTVLIEGAGDTKELRKQTEELRALLQSLNPTSPEQKDFDEVVKARDKILQMDKLAAVQRAAAIELVWDAYRRKQQQRRDEAMAKEKAAADQAEQQRLQKVQEFGDQLADASASGEQKAQLKLQQHIAKINELTTAGSADWLRLVDLANRIYLADMAKLWDEDEKQRKEAAKKKAEDAVKEINDAIAAANTIARATQLVQQGKLSRSFLPDPDYVKQAVANIKIQLASLYAQKTVSDEQINQITKLQEALDKLNRLNLTPFQKVMQQLKDNMQQIAQQVTQAWSQFWSDLASGTANAGKKFLAALIDTIAQQLEIMAVSQVAQAIAAAADLDFAGAARHAAAAAGLAALGGILQGFAASLTQSQSAAAATVPAPAGGSSSPTNFNPATISVGSSGGPQNAGSAQQTQHIVQLEIKPSDAFVVNAVTKNISGNGTLRTVIRRKANG